MEDEQDSSPSGLRERKKIQTREALADAAARLLLEHGPDELRVEDIAAAANVSVRTFSNYFPSKRAALAAQYVDRMRRAAPALDGRPADEPLWHAITEAIVEPWGEAGRGHNLPEPEVLAELRSIYGAPGLQGEIFAASLAADHPFTLAVAARTGTDPIRDHYPRLVTAVVTAASQSAVTTFLRADPPVALVRALRDALGEVARGLPTPATVPARAADRSKASDDEHGGDGLRRPSPGRRPRRSREPPCQN